MSGLSPGYINSRSFHFLLHSLCPLWTKPTLSCLEGKNKGMTKAKTLFITAILSHGKLASGTQYCVSPVKILLCHHFLGRPVWTPKWNYLWETDQHQWQQLPSRSSQLEAIFPAEGHWQCLEAVLLSRLHGVQEREGCSMGLAVDNYEGRG